MLIIDVKDNESIDQALKRYKRKSRSIRLLDEVRRRKYFEKPSVQKRNKMLKAAYKEHLRQEQLNG